MQATPYRRNLGSKKREQETLGCGAKPIAKRREGILKTILINRVGDRLLAGICPGAKTQLNSHSRRSMRTPPKQKTKVIAMLLPEASFGGESSASGTREGMKGEEHRSITTKTGKWSCPRHYLIQTWQWGSTVGMSLKAH